MAPTANLADEFTLPDTSPPAAVSPKTDLGAEFSPPQHAPEVAAPKDLSAVTPKEWWSQPRSALDSLKWMKARFYETAGEVGAKTFEEQTTPLVHLPEAPADLPTMTLPGHILPVDVEAGLYEAARPVIEGFTSRVGLGTLPLAAAGKAIPAARAATAAIGGLFTADMAAHLPDQVKEAVKVIQDPDSSRQQKVVAFATPGVTAVFTALGAAGTVHEAAGLMGGEKPAPPPGEAPATAISPETKAREELNRQLTPETRAPAATPDLAKEFTAPPEAPKAGPVEAVTPPEKVAAVRQALADPESEIVYNVWSRDAVPEGKSRVLQVDLPSPNAPETAGGRNYSSASLGLLREFGVDAPEPPESLPPGHYTLQQVREAVASSPKLEDEFQLGPGETAGAPPVGLGAASAEEFKPVEPAVTSTKNAQVDLERSSRGLPAAMAVAKREFPRVWDEAMARVDENQNYPDQLVAELERQPRAVTDVENAVLLHRQIDLQNDFARVTKRINEGTGSEVTKESDLVRHAQLSDQLLRLYNVGKAVGTETGRGLAARRMLANEDFSLAAMVTERRAAKGGGGLTPEELSETAKLHEKIAATQQALDDYKAATEKRLQDIEAARPPPVRKRVAEFIAGRLAEGRVSAGLNPEDLADYSIIGADYIAKGLDRAADWGEAMVKEFGEKIRPHLADILNRAKAEVEAIGREPVPLSEDARLARYKARLKSQTGELARRTAEQDFSPKAKREPLQLDEEAQRLQAERDRARQKYQETVIMDRLGRRTRVEKAQDVLTKWRRGFLLSSPVTLAKLTSAAVQRAVFTPLEEAVGAGYSRMFPSLARRAPREGGLNVRAEARAITEGLSKGMEDSYKLLTTGKSDLDVLFGRGKDGAVRESDVVPRSVIDFFGQIHGALKAPTKRAEFTRSLEKRLAWNMEQGVDVTDPLVQTRLMVEAYKDANRSIFLQDNVVVSAFNAAVGRLLKKERDTGHPAPGGKATATAAKILLPIVRVPTNIVAETIQTAAGLVTGSVRLAHAYRKGVDTLPPEQADLILRQLKKGSLGAAVMLLGYFNADKVGGYYRSGQPPRKGDVKTGSVQVFGLNIPSFLLHNPLLEVLQLGATIRRVQDSKLKKRDTETQGVAEGAWAAALGLLEEVPFIRQQLETSKVFDSREGPYARAELAKSLTVPAGVDFIARHTDRDAQGNLITRRPATLLEHIKTGIPGLREQVPVNRKK